MIFVERTVVVNPVGATPLTRSHVWDALARKARNAVPYVVPITVCDIVREYSADEFDREVAIHGDRYVERVVLGAERGRVVYTRLSGPILGVIVNDIIESAPAELGLRFAFALAIRPDVEFPLTEAELAEHMAEDYLAAIDTTLAAARELLAAATPTASAS